MSIAIITIKEQKDVFDFQIHAPVPNHYHPIELKNCGVYAFNSKNYDYALRKAQQGYEFWLSKYNYSGVESKIIQLSYLDEKGKAVILFSDDFRVSTDEKKVTLRSSTSDGDIHRVIIKDISNTKKEPSDVISITYDEIVGSNKNIYGSIGFNGWSEDSRYYWGNIFDGAEVTAFFRVDLDDLSYKVYETPRGTLGGDVLNTNNGYLTYDPNAYWSPDADDMEKRKDINVSKGLKSELHLRHLPTGKDIIITTTEPLWRFMPTWLSDTELEYQLPDGTKKTYSIVE